MQQAWSMDQAQAYTRWLARHHYENFHIVSALLPARLHQDFYNVYAFCRWADDLGDEIGDRAESLRLLAWWRGELRAMYGGGAATHRCSSLCERPWRGTICPRRRSTT